MGPSPLALQPQPVSEIFDGAFRMYRSNFGLFAALGLASEVPDLVRSLLSGGAQGQDILFTTLTGTGDAGRSLGSAGDNPLLAFAGTALWLICLPIALSLAVQAAVEVSAGTRPSFGRVLSSVVRRYWPVATVMLLFALAAVPSITCVLIPLSIWLYVRWAMAFPAIFAEGAGPIRSIERSTFLVAGRWWRTFGIVLLAYVLTSVVGFAIAALLELAVALVPGITGAIRGGAMLVAGAIGEGFVRPLWPIILTLVYFDLRVRREALELDVLAQQAMLAPPQQPA
ncbi:MAG: hypothetical protein WAT58_06890 [Candidatus Dormiibacterota bacterium]